MDVVAQGVNYTDEVDVARTEWRSDVEAREWEVVDSTEMICDTDMARYLWEGAGVQPYNKDAEIDYSRVRATRSRVSADPFSFL